MRKQKTQAQTSTPASITEEATVVADSNTNAVTDWYEAETTPKEAVEAVTNTDTEVENVEKDWSELEVSEKEAVEAVRGSRVTCIATCNRGSFRLGQKYELSPQVYKRYQSMLELVQ